MPRKKSSKLKAAPKESSESTNMATPSENSEQSNAQPDEKSMTE